MDKGSHGEVGGNDLTCDENDPSNLHTLGFAVGCRFYLSSEISVGHFHLF